MGQFDWLLCKSLSISAKDLESWADSRNALVEYARAEQHRVQSGDEEDLLDVSQRAEDRALFGLFVQEVASSHRWVPTVVGAGANTSTLAHKVANNYTSLTH